VLTIDGLFGDASFTSHLHPRPSDEPIREPLGECVEGLGGLALRIAMRLADDLELQALLHVVSSFDLPPAPCRRLEEAYEQERCQLGRRSRKRRMDGRLRVVRSLRIASAIYPASGASPMLVRRCGACVRWSGA